MTCRRQVEVKVSKFPSTAGWGRLFPSTPVSFCPFHFGGSVRDLKVDGDLTGVDVLSVPGFDPWLQEVKVTLPLPPRCPNRCP